MNNMDHGNVKKRRRETKINKYNSEIVMTKIQIEYSRHSNIILVNSYACLRKINA